jgi:hypothetical protein
VWRERDWDRPATALRRSTPELDRLQAHLSTVMAYRTAADLLEQVFPVDAAKHPETLRRHTLKAGEALCFKR